MGLALAAEFRRRGARVTLVSGPGVEVPSGLSVVPVVSAREMLAAVKKRFSKCDVFVSVAAVSDYRPATAWRGKMERQKSIWTLQLVPNPDILAETARRKKKQFCVGFSLENSAGNIDRASLKMRRKNCDMMVLNSIPSMGSGRIDAKLLLADGSVKRLGKISKDICATKICQTILEEANF